MNTQTLPALKSLGTLSDCRPVIVVDSREQTPLTFKRLQAIRGTLTTGDYSIAGLTELFAVERKSTSDLASCCCGSNRQRFERELHRLRGFRFKRLLIVGSRTEIERGTYRSNVRPRSVLASLSAWEMRFDIPTAFEPDPEAAAQRVESWSFWFAREYVRACNDLWRARRP
jgi:DNA excision repair protein ERCC-4